MHHSLETALALAMVIALYQALRSLYVVASHSATLQQSFQISSNDCQIISPDGQISRRQLVKLLRVPVGEKITYALFNLGPPYCKYPNGHCAWLLEDDPGMMAVLALDWDRGTFHGVYFQSQP